MAAEHISYPIDEWLAFRGRFVNVDFMLEVGPRQYLIRLHEGHIASIRPGPHVMPRWTFRLSASQEAWDYFWSPTPRPRYHDLMAMVKFKEMRIEGDQAVFMANLLYFKELIAHLGKVELDAR